MKDLKRKISKFIKNYYLTNEKILIIDGARQVGKSYIVRKVCSELYKNYIEIDFFQDSVKYRNFLNVGSVNDFYFILNALYGSQLGNYSDTIIFLDEIQVYPQFLTLLKFLNQDKKYRIICSGSLLGITLKNSLLSPMGAVDIVKMYPMNFEEYLYANNINEDAIEEIRNSYINLKSINISIHNIIFEHFKNYLLIGGLPECVRTFIETNDINKVRYLHEQIFNYYINDASKYDLDNKLETKRVYEYLPSLMEKTKNRVIIKDIKSKKGFTFKYYEKSFEYLINSGIAIGVNSISNPVFPLIESVKKSLMKLYMNDIGLLTSILYKNNTKIIKESISSVNLGNVYETIVAIELKHRYDRLYYYDNKKNGEVDFLIDDYDNQSIIPIEVKSGKNYYKHFAINNLLKEKNCMIKKGIILNNNNEIVADDINIYLPIYYIMFI